MSINYSKYFTIETENDTKTYIDNQTGEVIGTITKETVYKGVDDDGNLLPEDVLVPAFNTEIYCLWGNPSPTMARDMWNMWVVDRKTFYNALKRRIDSYTK